MIKESENQYRTVKLFVRANPELGCERQKRAVLERLDKLETQGQIATYKICIWAKEIRVSGPLEGTQYYQRVFDHFTAFQQWANEESVMLKSAFNIQLVDCEITDETYRVLSLPSICVAVYEDGELCGVFPHADGETVRTVSHCLDSLENSSPLEYAD